MTARKVNKKKRTFDVAFDLTADSQFGKPHRQTKHFLPNPDVMQNVHNPSQFNDPPVGPSKFNFGGNSRLNSAVAGLQKQGNLIGNDDSQ